MSMYLKAPLSAREHLSWSDWCIKVDHRGRLLGLRPAVGLRCAEMLQIRRPIGEWEVLIFRGNVRMGNIAIP